MANVLKVRAKPGVLVAVPCLHGSVARYVGRDVAHDVLGSDEQKLVDAFLDGDADHDRCYPLSGVAEFKRSGGLDAFNEIARAVRHGDLEAADEETAAHCGVKFAVPSQADTSQRRSAQGEE